MELTKVRSYQKEVVDRLFEIVKHNSRIQIRFTGATNCCHDGYPLFCLTIGSKHDVNLVDVLISAGVHGEEPAGVLALLYFLEKDLSDFGDYRFIIFPCINPFGFERNHRLNHEGLDVNRQFKNNTSCVEADKVMNVLKRKGRRFVCAVDLHETDSNYVGEGFVEKDNPDGFYMWEVCSDKNLRIGDRVIESIERSIPVCKQDTIYEDKNSGGVIWYPEGCGNKIYAEKTTLEGFLADNYTPQAFTLETPCGWHINQRVFAHRAALRGILELKRRT